jgi:pimeloyl-ACP methyl ester carboxylesterase
LAYREWNAYAPGLPLVVLHGVTGSSTHWHEVAIRMANLRVIAPDARGHGASDWDPEAAYTVDMHFADVASALDALGIERCVLAGFSMGGGTAILSAACMPERVAGLVVIDAYPYPEQSTGSSLIARWVAAQTAATTFDPAIARRFDELLAAGVSARADLTSMWRAVSGPALVVRGAESSVLPAATAAAMLADQPLVRFETIPGVAHAIPLAKPAELAAVLRGFVASLPHA